MERENLIYGFHSAQEAIRKRPRQINRIWVADGPHSDRLRHILAEARDHKIVVQSVERRALDRLTGTRHHQDIALEVSPYTYVDAEKLLEDVPPDAVYCILDEIQDVTNFAALIRTAEGAGVRGIFIPERRSAAVTATTHRLSAGALEHMKIARVTNVARLIEQMQNKGIRIICADVTADRLWFEADYAPPLAILVGNEYKGVRRLLKEKSDEVVAIPMLGKVQSLNVNVAAAILLYEAIRRKKSRND